MASRIKAGTSTLKLLLIDFDCRGGENPILAAVRQHGFEPEERCVRGFDELAAALEQERWTAIVVRFTASARHVVAAVRDRDPDVPLVLVCEPDEQSQAFELLSNGGANDCIRTDALPRLGPALERELRHVHLREENRFLFDALRRADTRYKRVFDRAPIGVAISTPTGTIVTVNERFLAIFGYTREELVGLRVWQLAHPDEKPPATLPSAAHSVRHTIRYVRKDGSTVWANVTVSAIATPDSVVEQLVWLIEDTTAHYVAEERLALQSLLLDSVEQAVIATDLDGKILDVNRYAETLYGASADELFATNIVTLASDAAMAPVFEQLRKGRSWSGELPLRRRDGTTFAGFVVQAPILDANGNLAGMVGVSSDITARRNAEEELRSSREQLAVAQRIAKIGSWEYDLTTGKQRWSDEMLRIYGFEPGDTPTAAQVLERVHPDDREEIAAFARDIRQNREAFAKTYRVLLPDGTLRHVRSHGTYTIDRDGHSKLTGVVQDVTEARAQEHEIEQRAVQQAAVANLGQAALSGASVDRLIGFAIAIVTEYLGIQLAAVLETRPGGFRVAGGTDWLIDTDAFNGVIPAQALYALDTRVPLVVTDLASETRFAPSPMLLRRGIVSGVTVPIIGGNAEPWGVLQAFTTTRRDFLTSDVDFVRTIATVLGQAIMRTRADEELRTRARQQSAIAELSRVALRSIDQSTFDLACALARERLGVKDAALLIGGNPPRGEEEWTVKIPVASPQTHFGLFGVRANAERAFNDTEMDFLQALANIIADALERERAAGALAASELRYREVVEGASEVIFTLSLDGLFTSLNNAAFENVTGWSNEEWTGKPYLQLVHPDDREHSRNVFRRLITERRAIVDELRIFTRHGVATIEVTSFAKIENGMPSLIYGFARDITATRQAEQERQQLTRNLQLLLESTVEGIITFDLNDRCTMSNTAAARVLGRTPDEMLNVKAHALLHGGEGDDDCADCFTAEVARTERVISETNERFYRKDGTLVPVDYSAAPVIDNGIVVGVVVSFSNITDRLRLEAKLEQANRVASLGRLAATVAHEFNNVLMGISPFVEVIRRGRDVERAAEHISRTIKRGKRITEDILRFTQPAEPVRTTFDVRAWLQNLLFEARLVLPRTIALVMDEVDPSLRINGDPNQLQQVFTNLILNARDAMPDGGTLTLRAVHESPDARFAFGLVEHPERFAHFEVSDTGAGMSPETLKHIFEPLFTTKRSGTGLGLPVAHQVVLRHSGEMFVESELGLGTAFHIFLPLAHAEDTIAPVEAPASTHDASESMRVLLVEDDESVAAGLGALLELEGLHVSLATTGEAAIEFVRRNRPDVVVLDVGLPDMDGTAVYSTISAIHESLPVIFSTGHGDRTRLESLLEHAHVAFLLKPYDAATLLQTIREVTNATAAKTAQRG